jgi:hypothetical protein
LDPPLKKKAYWCLLPVGLELRKNSGYSHIISGCFQLPLIEGTIPSEVITSSTPYETTLDLLRQKKSPLKLSDHGSTILVRVLHPLLRQLFSEKMKRWQDHINTSYLIDYLTAAATATTSSSSTSAAVAVAPNSSSSSLFPTNLFAYDMSRFHGAKTIEKQFQKTKEVKKLLKRVNVEFAQYTQIHQDAL